MENETLKTKDQNVIPVSPGFGIRHVQVIVMSVAATVLYMMRSSMGVAILNMTDQSQANNTDVEIFTWSEEIRGVILSSFFWGYVVMQIPAGVIAKKFGGKPLMLVGLIGNGTLCLITPILTKLGDWMAMCAVRVAMGLTQACLVPCTHTLLGQWAPPQERSVMSIVGYLGVQIGTVLTMPICGVLSSTFLGWKLIFYTIGLLAFLTAILFWALTASTPREHRLIKEQEIEYIETSLNNKESSKQSSIPWKKIFTSVPLFAIGSAHLGSSYCFTLFLVETPTYLKSGLGIDMANSAILSALPFLSQALLLSLASYLSDFIVNRKILSVTHSRKIFNSIGSFGMGACLVALSFLDSSFGMGACLVALSFLDSDHQVLAIVLACCSMGLLGFANCGYMLNHLDITPNYAGLTYGITNCTSSIISIFAPISTGLILGDQPTDPARWRIVFCSAAALIISCDVIYRTFGSAEIQPWNEPEQEIMYSLGSLKKRSLANNEEIKSYTFVEHATKKEEI